MKEPDRDEAHVSWPEGLLYFVLIGGIICAVISVMVIAATTISENLTL